MGFFGSMFREMGNRGIGPLAGPQRAALRQAQAAGPGQRSSFFGNLLREMAGRRQGQGPSSSFGLSTMASPQRVASSPWGKMDPDTFLQNFQKQARMRRYSAMQAPVNPPQGIFGGGMDGRAMNGPALGRVASGIRKLGIPMEQ
jgi:hypothetical protein